MQATLRIPVRRVPRRISRLTRHHPTLHAPNRIGSKSVLQVLQEMAHFFTHIPVVRVFRKKRLTPEELEPRMLMTAGLDALLDPAQATNIAVHSGAWSDASTWQNGVIPTDHARVFIPQGISVIYDLGTSPNLAWIRDEGALTFADTRNENLLVETIYVAPTGHFDIGTATNPFVHHVTITFADTGPLDLTSDPGQWERGLVSEGHFAVYGQHVDSFVPTLVNPTAGDIRITVASSVDWHVGDRILITGIVPGAHQDEEATIVAITRGNGYTTITLDHALQFDHVTGWPDLHPYVADESRTVTFTSENTTDSNRFGHLMFMHNPDVTINYSAIVHMGRTDKGMPIDDVVNFYQDGRGDGGFVPGGGTNVRGRYALHFHENGTDPSLPPIQVVGNFLTDSPGWGYVNHCSNVDFTDNVSYNVDGAAFVTETGCEIGSFIHNLAVFENGGGRNGGDPNDSLFVREMLADWGFQGIGFSMAGGGVDLINNVSCGAARAGYFYVSILITGLCDEGAAQYPTAALIDPSIANGEATINADRVPIHMFYGNEAFACTDGFGTYTFRPTVTDAGQNVIDQFLVWGVSNVGIHLDYADDITIRDSRVLNDGTGSIGIMQSLAVNLTVENCDVEGWFNGLRTSPEGMTIVSGGYWYNTVDIELGNAIDSGRSVFINDVTFANDVGTWVDYHLPTWIGMDCLSSQGTVTINGQTLYAPEQAADYVPFSTRADLPDGAPRRWAGMTNQQLMDLYGVAVGGVVATPDAVTADNIGGLIGA
jgi:G8 domain